MTTELLSLILWIPFGFPVLIYGLIFCIRGYKKGLYRALISLGTTLVACIASVFLARLISPSLANKFAAMIPAEEFEDMGVLSSIMPTLLKGVIQNVLALVLFSVFLFVLSIIFKAIASSIKKDSLQPENKGMRWGGFAVRLFDALLICLLLMLPIYGTAAAYVPMLEKSMSIVPTDDMELIEAKEYMNAVSKHPLVKVSSSKPVAAVYNGLAEIKAEEGSINIPQMVNTSEKFLSMVIEMDGMTEDELIAEAGKIVSFMRKEVVNQKWFYESYKVMKSETVKAVNEHKGELAPEEQQLVDEIMSSLEFSEKEFREVADEGLGVVEFILADGFVTKMEEQGAAYMYSDPEILSRIGSFLNCNNSIVKLKKLALFGYLTRLFDGVDETKAFLNAHPVTKKNDAASQKKEAEAFLLLAAFDNKMGLIESLARNPDFGFDTAVIFLTKELIADEFSYFSDSEIVEKYLNENSDFLTGLSEELKKRADQPISDKSFEDYVVEKMREALGLPLGSMSEFGGDVVVSFDGGKYTVDSGEGFTFNNGEGFIIDKDKITVSPDGSVTYYAGNGVFAAQ